MLPLVLHPMYHVHPALTTGIVGGILGLVLSFLVPAILPKTSHFVKPLRDLFVIQRKHLWLSALVTLYVVWLSVIIAKRIVWWPFGS